MTLPEDFFLQVHEVVRLIPYGKVTTYGAIAKFLGTAKSARMVGYAMNASHSASPQVPAHRVVNRNGMLTGKNHFPHPDAMREALMREGVWVVDDQIQQFHDFFWDPEVLLRQR